MPARGARKGTGARFFFPPKRSFFILEALLRISVIIPAYNAGRTLAETLDSVLGQAFEGGIEIIVVDDGSADDTAAVARRYMDENTGRADVAFEVVCQANAGVSAARNSGMERASGEFVAFLDADDRFAPGALGAFCTVLESTGADVAVGRLKVFGDIEEAFNPFADELSALEQIDCFDKRLLWNFLIGNKCYRRQRLIDSGVRFRPLRYAEDGAFFLEYVYTFPRITGAPASLYEYRRLSFEQGASVSQRVSETLASDFLGSMRVIRAAAETALAKREAPCGREDYLQEIVYKSDFVLVNQFYRLLWRADAACLAMVKTGHEALRAEMTPATAARWQEANSDLPELIFDKAVIAAKPLVSIILACAPGPDATDTAISVFLQSMPLFELLVPASSLAAGMIPELFARCENIVPVEGGGFKRRARRLAKSKRKVILTKPLHADNRMLRYLLRLRLPGFVKDTFFSPLFKLLALVLRFRGGKK